MKKFEKIHVESFDGLKKHEKEILHRINSFPNGGHLLIINPFRLFDDLAVILSQKAREEIIQRAPYLSALSKITYDSLKSSKSNRKFNIKITKLFRGE